MAINQSGSIKLKLRGHKLKNAVIQ